MTANHCAHPLDTPREREREMEVTATDSETSLISSVTTSSYGSSSHARVKTPRELFYHSTTVFLRGLTLEQMVHMEPVVLSTGSVLLLRMNMELNSVKKKWSSAIKGARGL